MEEESEGRIERIDAVEGLVCVLEATDRTR
jgi:hypothetical protein